MKRKTIAVGDLKEMVNRALRQDVPEEYRHGLCSLLESVLMTTGNYHGYNYVDWLEGGSESYCRQKGELSMNEFLNPKGMDVDPDVKEYLGPEYKRKYY